MERRATEEHGAHRGEIALVVPGMGSDHCAVATGTLRAGAVIAVLVLAAAVLAGACGDSTPRSEDEDPGLMHVHGLGVDPSDGELYVATHFGMFRVEEGDAERVGEHMQDLMGFIVADPGRFLASGHPEPWEDPILDEDEPPLLGLIESTDGGETWEALSLQGEADFHALDAAHDLVYGFDVTGGRFMVSADGRDWDERSLVELLSVAVSPEDRDHIVATGFDGVVVTSRDRGSTWQEVDGAPTLTFLSWDERAGLYGLGPEGSVHTLTDSGWEGRGSVGGKPAALAAGADVLHAATDEAILSSSDGGASWRVLFEID